MVRRLARVLLSLTVLAAALTAAPCGAGACPTLRQMDCCRMKPGITSPRCCPETQQLSREAAPATTERPDSRAAFAPILHVAPVVALASPLAPPTVRRHDVGRAPPGGPLLGQSTSLLL